MKASLASLKSFDSFLRSLRALIGIQHPCRSEPGRARPEGWGPNRASAGKVPAMEPDGQVQIACAPTQLGNLPHTIRGAESRARAFNGHDDRNHALAYRRDRPVRG